jgi:hypothetical protein
MTSQYTELTKIRTVTLLFEHFRGLLPSSECSTSQVTNVTLFHPRSLRPSDLMGQRPYTNRTDSNGWVMVSRTSKTDTKMELKHEVQKGNVIDMTWAKRMVDETKIKINHNFAILFKLMSLAMSSESSTRSTAEIASSRTSDSVDLRTFALTETNVRWQQGQLNEITAIPDNQANCWLEDKPGHCDPHSFEDWGGVVENLVGLGCVFADVADDPSQYYSQLELDDADM